MGSSQQGNVLNGCHGTSFASAKAIVDDGQFRPSTNPSLTLYGEGVYFYIGESAHDHAMSHAAGRHQETACVQAQIKYDYGIDFRDESDCELYRRTLEQMSLFGGGRKIEPRVVIDYLVKSEEEYGNTVDVIVVGEPWGIPETELLRPTSYSTVCVRQPDTIWIQGLHSL